MSVGAMQCDAASTVARFLLCEEAEKPISDQKIEQLNIPKVLGKRKRLDIPSDQFKKAGEFLVPMTDAEIETYQAKMKADIVEKREKLRAHEDIRMKEVALRKLLKMPEPDPTQEPKPVRPPKRIRSLDEMTAQEIELKHKVMEGQEKSNLTPVDPIKVQEAREKFEKLKKKAAKRALRKAAELAKAKNNVQEPAPEQSTSCEASSLPCSTSNPLPQ